MASQRRNQIYFLTAVGVVLVLGGIYKLHKNSPKDITAVETVDDLQIRPQNPTAADLQANPPKTDFQIPQDTGVRTPDKLSNERSLNEESIWNKVGSRIKRLKPWAETPKSDTQPPPETPVQNPSKSDLRAQPESELKTTPKPDLQTTQGSGIRIRTPDQFLNEKFSNEDSFWNKLASKVKSLLPFVETPESAVETPSKSDLPESDSKIQTPSKYDTQNQTKSFLRRLSKSGVRTPAQFLRERLAKAEVVWTKQMLKMKRQPQASDERQKNVWNHYLPTFTCPYLMERIGDILGSGKWICGLQEISRQLPPLKQVRGRPCVVYSYGISTDTSFEEEILQTTNCTVHGYDHTLSHNRLNARMRKTFPNRATFQQIGLGTKDEGPLRTLKTAMKEYGDEFIDILKVDAEGAEGGALPQIFKDFDGTFPFGQLLVEIHLGPGWALKTQKVLRSWWDILEEGGLRPFSKEVNTYPDDFCCFELSFLNVRVGHFALKIPPLRKFSVAETNKIVANLMKETKIEAPKN